MKGEVVVASWPQHKPGQLVSLVTQFPRCILVIYLSSFLRCSYSVSIQEILEWKRCSVAGDYLWYSEKTYLLSLPSLIPLSSDDFELLLSNLCYRMQVIVSRYISWNQNSYTYLILNPVYAFYRHLRQEVVFDYIYLNLMCWWKWYQPRCTIREV